VKISRKGVKIGKVAKKNIWREHLLAPIFSLCLKIEIKKLSEWH